MEAAQTYETLVSYHNTTQHNTASQPISTWNITAMKTSKTRIQL
jgi:hypothetical protein